MIKRPSSLRGPIRASAGRGVSRLLAAAIAAAAGIAASVLPADGAPSAASPVKPTTAFPDEQAAMDRLNAKPTQANRDKLAAIRHKRVVDLLQYAKINNKPEAVELALLYAESCTELSLKNAGHWLLLAQIYASMEGNEWAQLLAEGTVRKAIALDPDLVTGRILLGMLLYEQARFSKALDEFEAAMAAEPRLFQPPMVMVMSLAYVADCQWERGEKFFRAALRKNAKADTARLAFAVLLHLRQKDDEAAKELKTVRDNRRATEENRTCARTFLGDWKLGEATP